MKVGIVEFSTLSASFEEDLAAYGEAGVGALYLQHISGRYDPAAVAEEAARYFPTARVMNDFDRVTVKAAT